MIRKSACPLWRVDIPSDPTSESTAISRQLHQPPGHDPRCTFEKELGDRATDRLKELVAAGPVELTRVSCACEPGTEGTDRCNYGRSCAVLYTDGRNVSNILVGEGLAVPFVCSETKCPQTPRPWYGR